MVMKRRDFLKKSAVAVGSLPFLPDLIFSKGVLGIANAQNGSPVLVALFLRGGADGLNVVVPYGDKQYKKLRPTLAIPSPGKNGGALDLDGFFGLHPRLSSFKKQFDRGNLAVVHACGSHNETRSHFDAMDYMECGSISTKLYDGWLNRYLLTSSLSNEVFRAVALSPTLPVSLAGDASSIAIASLQSLQMRDSSRMDTYLKALKDLNRTREDYLGQTVREALGAIDIGQDKLNPENYKPDNGAVYPETEFGETMKAIAQMIKADIGLEVAATDLGGWDTHTNQGDGESGELANALEILDGGVGAFVKDIRSEMDRVVVLIMTEFGRTAEQNGSGGTDHGHGTAMFVLGRSVLGGAVKGHWPGLSKGALYEGRDLAITTDFRRIFGEVLVHHMGCSDIGAVFPGYNYNSDTPLNLFA
jgi:uncharacterized protein (DUF1501 family)